MPLGASRVQGLTPLFESYRFELWKDLIDGGWDFDYVGTETETGSYPNYENLSFDPDHQGKMSWTSEKIFEELESILHETGYPDIVLFSSPGGNDILDGLPYDNVIDNINGIFDFFQHGNPVIVILIEQLAPDRRPRRRIEDDTDQRLSPIGRILQVVALDHARLVHSRLARGELPELRHLHLF